MMPHLPESLALFLLILGGDTKHCAGPGLAIVAEGWDRRTPHRGLCHRMSLMQRKKRSRPYESAEV